MIIDLKKIPILLLNLEEDAERRRFVESQLAAFGLSANVIQGVGCQPSLVGCALSHLRALVLPKLEPPFEPRARLPPPAVRSHRRRERRATRCDRGSGS